MTRSWGTASGTLRRLLVLATAVSLASLIAISISTKPARSAPDFEYALGMSAGEFDAAELARTLDKAKAAGVNTVSSGAVWWYLSTGERTYDWSYLDRFVNAAEARGMTVKLQLSGTPDWVHPNLTSTVPRFFDRIWYPPRGGTELSHWSDFVHDVVSRYKGRVADYEMWNEPNIEAFWKPKPNPREYAALLRASYLSAKKAYPGARVAFGGLSRNDVGYLNAYYSAARKYRNAARKSYFFDVMNVHPYSTMHSSTAGVLEEPISPDKNAAEAVFNGAYGTVNQNFLGIEKIKSAMNGQGDPGKTIFLGEYGFPTSDTWMKAVPDYRRALYLKRAYAQARSLPYVEGMSWYAYRPSSADSAEWAIVDADLNETMTFRALKQTTGAEPTSVEVSLSAPQGTVSGTYEVAPVLSGLSHEDTSGWELYVDGALVSSQDQAPFDWDTRSVTNGTHSLMIVAYTKEGSVFASEPVPVSVSNGAGSVSVSSLSTDADNYAVGGTVRASASVSADVATTVDALTIEARPKGTTDSSLFNNFFYAGPYTIETSPKVITARKVIDKPGTYVLWVSYKKDGSWRWLKPEKEFTVR